MDSVSEVYLAATQSGSDAPSMLEIMLGADIIVQLVLLVLIVMSVMCWAVIARKAMRLREAEQASSAFLDAFWQAKRLDQVYSSVDEHAASPVAMVFKSGYKELVRIQKGGAAQDPDLNLSRALRRAQATEHTKLMAWIPLLATTASAAPFIGLFGTVWGILQAFLKLGGPGAKATLQVVGPDIAHALIATAVGLVAAIPAVMAYNWFSARLDVLDTEMENFSSDFLNLIRRRAA